MTYLSRCVIGVLMAVLVCGPGWAASPSQNQKVTVQNQSAASTAVAIRCVNTAGNAFEACGSSGTQYTEGDTDASITGTAIMWEDTSDTLRAVSAAKPLPVNIVSTSVGSTTADDDGTVDDGTTSMTQVLNLNYAHNGSDWLRVGYDPCSGPKTYLPINVASAATFELVNGAGSGNYYYICSLNLVTAGANNVSISEDDTDNCASITAGLAGGITAGSGWNFAANGGLTLGNGTGTVIKSAGTNRFLCMVTSASTQLSGGIAYVVAP